LSISIIWSFFRISRWSDNSCTTTHIISTQTKEMNIKKFPPLTTLYSKRWWKTLSQKTRRFKQIIVNFCGFWWMWLQFTREKWQQNTHWRRIAQDNKYANKKNEQKEYNKDI
jgi:hypothetical protein